MDTEGAGTGGTWRFPSGATTQEVLIQLLDLSHTWHGLAELWSCSSSGKEGSQV